MNYYEIVPLDVCKRITPVHPFKTEVQKDLDTMRQDLETGSATPEGQHSFQRASHVLANYFKNGRTRRLACKAECHRLMDEFWKTKIEYSKISN